MEPAQEGSCNRDRLNKAISQPSQRDYNHKTLNPFLEYSDAVLCLSRKECMIATKQDLSKQAVITESRSLKKLTL